MIISWFQPKKDRGKIKSCCLKEKTKQEALVPLSLLRYKKLSMLTVTFQTRDVYVIPCLFEVLISHSVSVWALKENFSTPPNWWARTWCRRLLSSVTEGEKNSAAKLGSFWQFEINRCLLSCSEPGTVIYSGELFIVLFFRMMGDGKISKILFIQASKTLCSEFVLWGYRVVVLLASPYSPKMYWLYLY